MNDNNLRLKFRMWNENLKKMTYFDNPEFVFHKNSEKFRDFEALFAFHIAENNSLYFGEYKIVMQSINLFDIDGKQAYEDDVIQFQNTEGKIFKKRIIWDDKSLCYLLGNMPYQKIVESAYFHTPLKFLILGNVYENPELKEGEYAAE